MKDSQKSIRRRRETINRRISVLRDALNALQVECAHPAVIKKYDANTGNYDPGADSYWIEWNCPDCGKHWSTDQ